MTGKHLKHPKKKKRKVNPPHKPSSSCSSPEIPTTVFLPELDKREHLLNISVGSFILVMWFCILSFFKIFMVPLGYIFISTQVTLLHSSKRFYGYLLYDYIIYTCYQRFSRHLAISVSWQGQLWHLVLDTSLVHHPWSCH